MIKITSKDSLQVPIRSITRSRTKKFKDTFNELI
jgi:hypothetical protein